jgi:hypothetical protein
VKPAGPVRLGEVELDGTVGAYAFVLMTSTEPLPSIRQIEQPPVLTRGRGGDGTLEGFLLTFGNTRAPRKDPPKLRWSVERVGFVAGQ